MVASNIATHKLLVLGDAVKDPMVDDVAVAKNIGCPFGNLEVSEVGLAVLVIINFMYNLQVVLEVSLVAVG